MKVSYNWLQSFFLPLPRLRQAGSPSLRLCRAGKKLPSPEKLADLLSLHSFETEVIGRAERDYVLDVDILPNRAHNCLGHLGIAREIAAITNYKLQITNYKQITKHKSQITNLIEVKVEDKKLCPRYMARMAINVKVGLSPKWIQERLKVCGLKPINNVVDIVNYVMLEIGQPMHAFDFDKIAGEEHSEVEPPKSNFGGSTSECSEHQVKTLIVRRAKKGEKIISLDNETYNLDKNILVIADAKKPLCIAGIKGGKDAEINKNTKRIVLEAANFDSRIIRKAFNQLKLRTDASWRFENELDPNLTTEAMDMAAALIQDIANGQILEGVVDIYPNKIKPRKIKLDAEKVRSLLGVNISDKEIVAILKKLGFDAETRFPSGLGNQVSKFQVAVPTCRLDVSIQEDLIEEIGRLYGFEKISSHLPSAALIPPKLNIHLIYQNKIKDILVNLGFSETLNYSLIGDMEIGYCRQAEKPIELSNPISQEQKYLRPCLMLNLLKNIESNKRYFKEVRLFEVGKIFQRATSKGRQIIEEKKRLGAVLSLGGKSKNANEFYLLKGVVEMLLNKLGITDYWYDDQVAENDLALYRAGRRAEVKVGNDCLGWLGEINEEALKKAGVKLRATGFEFNFEKIAELANEERIYLPPSKYPAVVRDVALLVEPGTKIVEVMNLINAAGGSLISDVDLFDMYEGEEIPDGKKSLAFRVIYQADDHTLTDKEVNALQEKVIQALEDEGGWEVRKQ